MIFIFHLATSSPTSHHSAFQLVERSNDVGSMRWCELASRISVVLRFVHRNFSAAVKKNFFIGLNETATDEKLSRFIFLCYLLDYYSLSPNMARLHLLYALVWMACPVTRLHVWLYVFCAMNGKMVKTSNFSFHCMTRASHCILGYIPFKILKNKMAI